MLIVYIATYFNLYMFNSAFPSGLLTALSASSWAWLLPFNPLSCFAVSFQDNSNLVSLRFGLPSTCGLLFILH